MLSNHWLVLAGLTVVIALGNGTARAAELTEGHCIVLAEKPDGKVDTLPGTIAVLEPTRTLPNFSLTLPAGYEHGSVMCRRSDIVPSENDWKVLEAGYPLMISVQGNGGADRTLGLESITGHLQIRFVKGDATAEELPRLQARVNQLQTAIQDAFMARKAQH